MKIQGPKPRSKRGQNVAMGKRRDRAKQWPPQAARGGAHGPWWRGARSCPRTYGSAPWWCYKSCRLRTGFRLLAVFALFLPYNIHLLGHLKHPIHSLSISIFILRLEQFFRGRKRERRITVRILDRVLRSKDGSMRLDEQILFLLLSFLALILYFVILL